ncbi:MAG: hypothetical protein U0802_19465 [Candidatus Binatia bacterium]
MKEGLHEVGRAIANDTKKVDATKDLTRRDGGATKSATRQGAGTALERPARSRQGRRAIEGAGSDVKE